MRVIPETQLYNFKVNKVELIESLKRMAIMVDKKSGRIFFNICPGVLKLTSQESDSGDAEVEIPCEYAGDEITIAMNFRYIEEPLKAMNCDRIKFEFSGEMKAVTILSEPAEDYFHIVMPMQM